MFSTILTCRHTCKQPSSGGLQCELCCAGASSRRHLRQRHITGRLHSALPQLHAGPYNSAATPSAGTSAAFS